MAPDVKVAAVIVAAGSGKRIGGTVKKQFLELKGKPILVHTLERFQACSDIDEIVLVAPQNELRRLEDEIVIKYLLTKVKRLVGGGEERYNSVYNGLNVLPEYIEIVAVHDGVRPFISSEKISRLVNEAQRYGAAIPGVQPKDTVKSCRQGLPAKRWIGIRWYWCKHRKFLKKRFCLMPIGRHLPANSLAPTMRHW